MSREAVPTLRRIGLFLVVLAVCAGAGWQVGRVVGPELPPPAVDVPALPAGAHVH